MLGARASTALVQREHHSHGETYHPPAMPDAVCYPHTTEEVSEILKISAKYKVPVIPFGGGTSLEGHVNALYGGISIDLREMNKVLRVSPEDLDVTVEAGVTRQQLNKALNNTGLTFYVDPGGESTLGGMAATRASGTTTVRYGTMRDNVLALTVVMADGTIINTGTRARKSSAGYDLTRLFVGSEGTLGVITELTLRLHPLPEAVSAAVCSFPSIENAVKTVIETIQFGASVARIELLDDAQMDAINKYSKTNYPVAPTLFFEFHGSSDRHVAEQAEFVQSIAEEHGARDSNGLHCWKIATNFGKHGTRPTTLQLHSVPAQRAWPPMRACPSRVLPSASGRHRRTIATHHFPLRWWATSAMEIFTASTYSILQMKRKSPRPSAWRGASPLARSPWAAPAPESTASAMGR